MVIYHRMFPKTKTERPDLFFRRPIWDMKLSSDQILIVGFGSIGSAIGLCLDSASIGYTCVDPDSWEDRNSFNSPGAWFNAESAPKAKIVMNIEEAYEKDLFKTDPLIVVTATDSIESRAFCAEVLTPKIGFVDCRTGKDTLTVVTARKGADLSMLLPDPERVEQATCSERGTLEHTFTLSGLAMCRIMAMLTNPDFPKRTIEQINIAAVPFGYVAV